MTEISPIGAAPGSPSDSLPRLRLLVLTLKPPGVSPGQRFRLEQWARYLRSTEGIELDFLPFESPQLTRVLYQPGKQLRKGLWLLYDFLRRARSVLAARRYDGVIVYREAALIGPAIYERLIAWSGVPLFFDFDDAVWLDQTAGVNGLFSRLHFWGKTETTFALSKGVIAGNEYLAGHARKRNPAVFVVPTTIDLADYPVIQEPAASDPFIVCWTGSSTTLRFFEYVRPALERLATLRPLVVKVICNEPPARPIAGAENRFVEWREAGEAEALGACHVGVMPLPDNDYTRGKCGLKALQFMATGRPVVISPVGVNTELVKHGQNGLLAQRTGEWVDCLLRLADNPQLRAELGTAARHTVEEGYAAEVGARKFGQAIRSSLLLKGAR